VAIHELPLHFLCHTPDNAKNVVAIHELPLHFLCHTQLKTAVEQLPISVQEQADKAYALW